MTADHDDEARQRSPGGSRDSSSTLQHELADTHKLSKRELSEVLCTLAQLTGEESQQVIAFVWWSFLIEPGDAVAGRLIAQLGPVPALMRVLADLRNGQPLDPLLGQSTDYRDALARWGPRVGDRRFLNALVSAVSLHTRVLIPGRDGWPDHLFDLGEHAPLCLWTIGRSELIDRPRTLSIVGARAATSYGLDVCAELVHGSARHGFTIVSGGAYGIDRQAHRAALAVNADTVAVLAGGVDRLYPAGNEQLLREIAERGCLVAEQVPGTPPTRWRFLQRNRIIASLGAMTVVVEAGRRSGALNTAHHAAQLGRHIVAVPGSVQSASSAGTNQLIRDGLAALVTCADDCLSLLTAQPELEMEQMKCEGLRPELIRVHDALHPKRPQEAQEISRQSGLPANQVRSCLNELELLQLARDRGGGEWIRS